MKADLVIKNGIVCSESGMFRGGVAVKDEKIIAIGEDNSLPESDKEYDAKGFLIFPGLVEPHAHHGNQTLTIEGFKSDLETETRAAAQGGITTINTTTLFGGRPLPEYLDEAIEAGQGNLTVDANVYLSPGTEPHIGEIRTAFEKGNSAFKFLLAYRGEGARMFGMAEEGIGTDYMYKAFSEIAACGGPAIAMVHCEDAPLFEYLTEVYGGKEYDNYLEAFHKARPNICEAIDLCKAAYIAHEVGCPLYQVHISTKEAIEQLEFFKSLNYDIIGETCLHYLVYSCEDECFVNNDDLARFIKVNPAIHERESRERLWKALQDGTIQCVGTDHNAYSRGKKLEKDFWTTTAGVGGSYPVLLPIMYSEGVNKGRIDIDTLRKVLCENPAKLFGLYPQKGTLNPGADADIVIIDPDKEMTIDYKDHDSAGEFNIYQGMKVKGCPVATFARGYLVAEDYKVVADQPRGKMLDYFIPYRTI